MSDSPSTRDAEDKPYVELFRQVEIRPAGPGSAASAVIQALPCEEKANPDEAEVCIPLHTETTVYAVTCYLTGVPNHQPAVREMLFLQDRVRDLIEMTEAIR